MTQIIYERHNIPILFITERDFTKHLIKEHKGELTLQEECK